MKLSLGDILLANYPALLAKRYGIPAPSPIKGENWGEGEKMDGADVIAAIAKRRGYLLKGGEPDLEKAALMLLQDYRTGALGRISLETTKSRSAMLGVQAPADAV
jgi:ribosome biogenesis GTPase A